MILKRAGLILVMTNFVTGCVSYTLENYQVSSSNQIKMRQWKGREIGVGAFSYEKGDKTSFMCRDVGLIKLPEEQNFAAYFQEAVTAELKKSGLYSESSDLVITGVINQIDYKSEAEDWGSSLSSGAWEISLTLVSSNGDSMKVENEYQFNTNWDARSACEKSAQAFIPAVQHLIYKAVASDGFAGLLN